MPFNDEYKLGSTQYLAETSHQNTIHVNEIIEQGEVDCVAIPRGYSMHELEKYKEFRVRPRGSLVSEHFDDFVEYIVQARNNQPSVDSNNTAVFINRDNMSAFAVLDYYAGRGHADNTATFDAVRTPLFGAVTRLASSNGFKQRELIHFIEDWGDSVEFVDGENETMSQGEAVAAAQSMTVEKAKKIKQTHGDMSQDYTISEQAELAKAGKFIAGMRFTDELYVGTERQVDVEVKLFLAVYDESFEIGLRILRLDRLRDDKVKELRDKLISYGITNYVGKYDPKRR